MVDYFESSKLYEGYSVVFRQWRATSAHCKYIHGYGVSFKITFAGSLDTKNWVYDFGGLDRTDQCINGMKPKEWLSWLFDHTILIAEDDPALEDFKELDKKGICQLRVVPAVGAERFAEYLFKKIDPIVRAETNNRAWVKRLEFKENATNAGAYGVNA